MNKLDVILAAVLLVCPLSYLYAEDIDMQKVRESAFDIKRLVLKDITNKHIEKVFDAKIYSVSAELKEKLNMYGSSQTEHECLFILHNQKLIRPKNVSVKARSSDTPDVEVPSLTKIINKNFKIASLADARDFEIALSFLYPNRALTSMHKDNLFGKKMIYKKADEWVFVRFVIFDTVEGFVVTVDNDGLITRVRYSYNLQPPKEPGLTEKDVSESLKKDLIKAYMDTLETKVKQYNSKEFPKVFNVKFFYISYDKGGNSSSSFLTFKKDGTYHSVKNPRWGSQKLKRTEQLESIIDKNFVLKNDQQATMLGTAISKLMNGRVILKPVISRKGEDWVIQIEKNTYFISTDKEGRITKIMCDPKYKK